MVKRKVEFLTLEAVANRVDRTYSHVRRVMPGIQKGEQPPLFMEEFLKKHDFIGGNGWPWLFFKKDIEIKIIDE